MSSVNFDESVKYLYLLGNEVATMKLGLDNIRALLEALRDPQKKSVEFRPDFLTQTGGCRINC